MARPPEPHPDPIVHDLMAIRGLRWKEEKRVLRLRALVCHPAIPQDLSDPARVEALRHLLSETVEAMAAYETEHPPDLDRSLAFAARLLLRLDQRYADKGVNELQQAIADTWKKRDPNTGETSCLSADSFRHKQQTDVYEAIAREFRSYVRTKVSATEITRYEEELAEEDVGVTARRSNVRIRVATSPEQYKNWVVAAEASARQIDRVPKRISVVFKDPATVEAIAARRYGAGSRNVEHYVAEHELRRTQFFNALNLGMQCREIYNRADLAKYVASRQHAGVVLEARLIRETLGRWLECLRSQENYFVALTDDPVPFKYAVLDRSVVVMHEAIGVADRNRVNGLFIESVPAASHFAEDFDVTWDRVRPEHRDRDVVADWVETSLLPLCNSTEE